ncbi:unnamed protein product [Arctia plantaginis]|uniref:Uncharacterized protein n=1 Tax=Arctia plantaginis TaxID=874455 RepID=A0A8S0ZIX9_ARCPL|nr:unnamed protein product [Arctia plantaginis]
MCRVRFSSIGEHVENGLPNSELVGVKGLRREDLKSVRKLGRLIARCPEEGSCGGLHAKDVILVLWQMGETFV